MKRNASKFAQSINKILWRDVKLLLPHYHSFVDTSESQPSWMVVMSHAANRLDCIADGPGLERWVGGDVG